MPTADPDLMKAKKTIEVASETWYFWFGLLKKFVEENNHSNVPARHFQDGFFLGKWVSHQRGDYKTGELSNKRIELLENLDNWTWYPQETIFENQFKLVQEYMEIYNKMPTKGHLYKGYNIGEYIDRWRSSKENNRLSKDKIKLIEQLPNFHWYKDEFSFQKNIQDLTIFSKREGHTWPPNKHIESPDGAELGNFALNMRNAYRGTIKTTAKINKERIRALENIPNWTWITQRENDWFVRYSEAKKLLEKTSFKELKKSNKSISDWIYGNFYRGVSNTYPNAEKLFKNLKDADGLNVYKYLKSNKKS